MVVESKGIRSRKRKRETEEAGPTANATSEKNLKETAPMILPRGDILPGRIFSCH